MIKFYLFYILTIWNFNYINSAIITTEEYFTQRDSLLQKESEYMLGSGLILNAKEQQLNEILMKEKLSEISNGFDESNYLPAKNFMLVRKEIEETKVFQIIKKLPKGASLHTHGSSSASVDWIIEELTYSDDLYMCRLSDTRIIFKYQKSSKKSCKWQNVSEERSNVGKEDFDKMLKKQLSIITDNPKDMYPSINDVWIKLEEAFESTRSLIFCNVKFFKKHLWRALQEQVDDGVNYIEYREGLVPISSNSGELSIENLLNISLNIINKFTADNKNIFHGAKFIYSQYRSITNDVLQEDLEMFSDLKKKFPDFVIGYDLVGQEDLGRPLKSFSKTFLSNNETTKLILHAGETNWQGLDSDENLLDALFLNTTRFGHGYAITKHPEIMQIAKKRGISVEICPISNQVLNLVEDLRNHPGAMLAAENFPLIVASDGYQMWGASPLSHDFYEAFHAFGGARADLRFLKQLILNSIKYSSLNSTEQEALTEIWIRNWDNAISQLLDELS